MDDKIKAGIRYYCPGDLEEILDIEVNSFPFPWSPADYQYSLEPGTGYNILVAIVDAKVAGFAVVEFDREFFEIVKVAVRHDMRRKGIGTQLINKIKSKVWPGQSLFFFVREGNTNAQLFLRSNGLVAEAIEKDFFSNQQIGEYDGKAMPWHKEDAYRFALPADDK